VQLEMSIILSSFNMVSLPDLSMSLTHSVARNILIAAPYYDVVHQFQETVLQISV
jgi:hypothetical protein